MIERDYFLVSISLFSDGDFNDLYKIAQSFEHNVLPTLADKVTVISCFENKPRKLRKTLTRTSVRMRDWPLYFLREVSVSMLFDLCLQIVDAASVETKARDEYLIRSSTESESLFTRTHSHLP